MPRSAMALTSTSMLNNNLHCIVSPLQTRPPQHTSSNMETRITITNEEEARLGIPEEYQGRSVVAQAAYNTHCSQHLPSIPNVHSNSP